MENAAAEPVEHAPINWVTAVVFTLTPLAALILVPWYGLTHGYGLSSWLLFAFLLLATGMSITAGYHRLQILHEVSLEVNDGEIVSIVGANGVAKTTTLNTIAGLVKPTSGTMERAGGQRLSIAAAPKQSGSASPADASIPDIAARRA